MKPITDYFDLNSRIRARQVAVAAGDQQSLHWLPQYLALIAGIFIEPYLASYRLLGTWNFAGTPGRLLFAVIIAFAVFPKVYKSVVTEPGPLVVQLGPIFMGGLAWQSLFSAAAKAVG